MGRCPERTCLRPGGGGRSRACDGWPEARQLKPHRASVSCCFPLGPQPRTEGKQELWGSPRERKPANTAGLGLPLLLPGGEGTQALALSPAALGRELPRPEW